MSGRSGRGRWVLLLLVLAVVVWVVAAPAWVSASGTSVLTGAVEVRVPGTRAAPGMVGAALALGAAGAALALAGRLGRWLVVVVVLLCGGLVGWSAVGLLADPSPAARQAVAAATGVDRLVGAVRTTPAPWFAILVAVLVMLSGVTLARASARWPGPSGRHEPAGGRADVSPATVPAAADLAVPAEPHAVQPAEGFRPTSSRSSRAAGSPSGGAAEVDASDQRADWDALTRGDDPT